jgi:DNA polymerase-4
MSRTVLFAEVPSFYAAVERADDPSLADRPVIVGGNPRKRGLVQAATEDALAEGVAPEMPMLEALQLCPRAKVLPTDMRRYREASRRLLVILRRGFPRLEAFGLGAAWFDLSGSAAAPEELAAWLSEAVLRELGLPLRVGIASNKFLARLAAEESGAAGTRRIAAGDERPFLDPLPVRRLDGVGRKTAATLAELGAHSIGDVAALGRERLEEVLGTHGLRIHGFASGDDDGPVRSAAHPQSVSREAATAGEALDLSELTEHLQRLALDLEHELRLQGLSAGRVTLKVRYGDQTRASRSQTLAAPLAAAPDIQAVAVHLLGRTQAGSRPVRGLGIQLSSIVPRAESDRQMDLFPSRS